MKTKLTMTVLTTCTLVFACTTETEEVYDACEVRIDQPQPNTAYFGDPVSITGHPLTEVRDTVLLVGGEPSDIIDLSRLDCEACDTCRLDSANCSACGDCDECDSVCNSCVESLTFNTPNLPAGEVYISIYNLYGASNNVALTILESDSTTTTDTSFPSDTGAITDTGGGVDTGITTETDSTGTQ